MVSLIRVDALPAHVAIVMDGNGRWAEAKGLRRTDGHRAGSEAVRRIVRACRRLGVETLSVFAFSAQNWDRPAHEVAALMNLFREFLISEREEVLRTGIRLRPIGRVERLPWPVRGILDKLVRDTAHLRGMTFQLAVSYGGQEEIADTARSLACQVADGTLDPTAIDERSFADALPSLQGGPVDLLVRTGGEQRISNFLLWGAAYAELYFSDVLWPDFDETELHRALAAFQNRDRRFGQVAAPRPSAAPDGVADTDESGLRRAPRPHVQ